VKWNVLKCSSNAKKSRYCCHDKLPIDNDEKPVTI
jgi:hypothetical protein